MSDKNPDLLNVYAQGERVYDSPVCGKLTLRSCFAVGSENVKQNERARDWAITRNNSNPVPVTRTNGGLKITIIDLESREEGGRAYKVVDQYGCMYDLRERVMLDIIKRVGINPGGVIPGTFRFIVDGSQQLLVPEDPAWVGIADRMAEKKPTKERIPYKFYSNKKETEFHFVLPGGYSIQCSTWYGKDKFLENLLNHAYGRNEKLPPTLYESPIQFEFSDDPARDVVHLMTAKHIASEAYWTINEVKRIVGPNYHDLVNELKADPSKIKKIRVVNAG